MIEALFLRDRERHYTISRQDFQDISSCQNPDAPLGPFTRPVSIYLDADWPLQFISEKLQENGPAILPVLKGGVLIGVFNTENFVSILDSD